MNLTHQYVQDQIQSGRKLSDEEQATLTAHLSACPECRAYAAFHTRLSELLPAAYPSSRHSAKEIRAKANLVYARVEKQRRFTQLFQTTFSLAGVSAAVVLVLVALGLLPGLMTGRPAATTEPVPAAAIYLTGEPSHTAVVEAPPADPANPAPTSTAARAANPRMSAEPEPGPAMLVNTEVAASVTTKVVEVPALAVDGQTVYVGIGTRLAAIDIRQPAEPQLLVQSQELPGEVLKVLRIPGEPNARIAASAGRYLAVFDPAVPGELGLLAQSKLPGPVTTLILEIGSNRIYAGGVLNGDASRGFVVVLDAAQWDDLHLLDSIELRAPVQSLAFSDGVLYAALTGAAPGIISIPVVKDQFGEPGEAITNLPVTSITAVRGVLYIGSTMHMLAYRLENAQRPELAWQIDRAGGAPLPGNILGFELRANLIFTAGLDASGQPFRAVIPLTQKIQTGSMVDTASHIAVTSGMMMVADERLEIYDVLDSQNMKLLGTYPAAVP